MKKCDYHERIGPTGVCMFCQELLYGETDHKCRKDIPKSKLKKILNGLKKLHKKSSSL